MIFFLTLSIFSICCGNTRVTIDPTPYCTYLTCSACTLHWCNIILPRRRRRNQQFISGTQALNLSGTYSSLGIKGGGAGGGWQEVSTIAGRGQAWAFQSVLDRSLLSRFPDV